MLKIPDLFVDTHSTVYDLLAPYCAGDFWEFADFDPPPGATVVVGRQQFVTNLVKVHRLLDHCCLIFDNAAEGSQTLQQQLQHIGLTTLVQQHRLGLISGGELDQSYNYLLHDHFFNVILGYDYNIQQMHQVNRIYNKKDKPYKFLFLNGRARPHRLYLWQKLKQLGWLDQSLCTMLEGEEIKQLPAKYEVEQYQQNRISPNSTKLIKHQMFNNSWGEIYACAEPYVDSYFSLVTETVVDCPHSFRTEKIAKPLLLGHPWIAAANRGFYRDLQNLGFRTFAHIIDESFDQIDNTQDRLDRITEIVNDLCQQDLASFVDSCYSVCIYNQARLQEYRNEIRSNFADRFFNYINERP
jgi:hypothetical protein